MRLLAILVAAGSLGIAQTAPAGEGAKLFAQTCQACHGDTGRAPSLAGPFRHGNSDSDLAENIRRGIAGTQMPAFASLRADELAQLVAYIRTLPGGSGKTEVAPGNPAEGERLFFGSAGCSVCHEVNGRGGIVGPDLSAAGNSRGDDLLDKIVTPSTRRTAREVMARTRDGREVRGLANTEDEHTVHIRDLSGNLHLFEKSKLARFTRLDNSLMPADYQQRLAPADLNNLVAYLATLRGRDLSQTVSVPLAGGLAPERIRNARSEPQNWLTYWGDYQGTHYSALKQIDTANVARLRVAWTAQMPGESILESTPLVADGIMYTSGQPGEVFALDARSGLTIWQYRRTKKPPSIEIINRYNRGVALLGSRVFVGTLDAAIVALDARTGRPVWEVQVADPNLGYSITSPPLAIKDRIIVGVSGGEYGISGFVDAYAAATGRRLWRFNTIPRPGEFGHETWKGGWEHGSGATWLTGSYDPELDLIYWAVGNPGPDLDPTVRTGDNLFTCSVVALDANTGERKWHYQFTPGDTHDWDSTEDLVLVDRVVRGKPQKLLLHADRNGMFYTLDRTSGLFLSATPFARQTWNRGFDEQGRPKLAPGSESSEAGSIAVFPDAGGATNFQAPSYNPLTGLFYVAYRDAGNRFISTPSEYQPGKVFWSGRVEGFEDKQASVGIKALDPATGRTVWDHKILQGSLSNGVLATAGGVLFGATAGGNLIALHARTGKLLWRFRAGGTMAASPISYAVDGKQYVAISGGNVLYAFALPD